MRLCYPFLTGCVVSVAAPWFVWTQPALAQDPNSQHSVEVQLLGQPDAAPTAAVSGSSSGDGSGLEPAPLPAPPPDDVGPPWGSSAGSWELGLFWGLFLPAKDHELYDADSPAVAWHRLEKMTPDLGLRAAWFPFRVFGLEVEGAFLPSQLRNTNQNVNLWGVRGSLILQAPTKAVVPFLLVGGGLLGVSSSKDRLGSDSDGVVHIGVGVKGYVTERLALRVDVRDNVTQGYAADKLVMHWEALLGLSVVLCRPEPPAPPPPLDSDHDGFVDTEDECPQVAGVAPHGCPPPPPDQDNDGIIDAQDACPAVPGVANSDPTRNGCPPPPLDSDGDGVPDERDHCPAVPGDGPDGCPLDTDGDGILNRDDKCPDQPETVNSYQDADGCPDEIPQAVKKFTGAIAGIAFETNKAVIRPSSYKVLDEAAKVLIDYPTLRVEISGHTDSSGSAERNLQLSRERAESVKAYLISKGVTDTRVETRGVGPNEPVADNKTADGRSKNRRVEFKLLMEQAAPTGETAPQPPPLLPGQTAPR